MKRLYPYILLAFTAIAFFACKKTVDYEHLAQNRITAFTVVNVKDTVIHGAIDNIKNSIIVYVPYYYSLSVIEPKITVDQGATLTTQIQPVNIADDKQTFSVKSSIGEVRTYSLKIIQQNPPSLSLSWPMGNNEGSPNATQVFYGNLRSTSVASLDVTLTQQGTNKTFKPDLSNALINSTHYGFDGDILSIGTLPPDLDSGYYKIDISFLGNKVTMDKPLHVVYKRPITQFTSKTLKQGDTFIIIPLQQTIFIDFKSITLELPDGRVIPLIVQSYNRTSATIKIPDDFPIIKELDCRAELKFGTWNAFIAYPQITIGPK
ncbi:hypothetical protein [Pedobacter sp. N23S346]|uniref:hypothetical protein n=1 Tax=Pedobacter sp. N23S346 TaxID=3402750 RepID=UPI003AC977C5